MTLRSTVIAVTLRVATVGERSSDLSDEIGPSGRRLSPDVDEALQRSSPGT